MKRSILKTNLHKTFAFICMFLIFSCTHSHMAPKKEPLSSLPAEISSPPREQEAFYVHVVQWSGETLSILSKWYTGSRQNWESIAMANPQLNPKRISIGDEILIPESLLKNRIPFPYEYLSDTSTEKKAPPTSPRARPSMQSKKIAPFKPRTKSQPSTKDDKIELFGPQDSNQPTLESNEIELFGPQNAIQNQVSNDDVELFAPKHTGIEP